MLEGVTEWLPISSTGHLLLLRAWLPLGGSEAFYEVFEVVIQLAACMAVLGVYAGRLLPHRGAGGLLSKENRPVYALWGKLMAALLPSAVIGLIGDDWIDAHCFNVRTVTVTLALYGVLYLILESVRGRRTPTIRQTEDVTLRQALGMGAFQVLALVPGTSRSGATVLGGLLLGFSRPCAAEFSFWLALPTMAGASGLKLVKFWAEGGRLSGTEGWILAIASLTALGVSVLTIRFLTAFVKKHTFRPFGVYRILLAVLVAWYLL